MFALSFRSIEGSNLRMDVEPGTTTAEIRRRLEERLPPHHEIRIFQGNHEILDGAQVEVELQIVATKSVRKALAKLREDLHQVCSSEHLNPFLLKCNETMAFVEEHGTLPSKDCEAIDDLVYVLARSNIPICFRVRICKNMGSTFGRVCGNPFELLSFARVGLTTPETFFKAAALVEISVRYKSLSPEEQQKILSWLDEALSWLDDESLGEWLMEMLTNESVSILQSIGDFAREHPLNALETRPAATRHAIAVAALREIQERKNKLEMSPLEPLVMTDAGWRGDNANVESGTFVAKHRSADRATDAKEPDDELEAVKKLSAREADKQADQQLNDDTLKALLLSKSEAIAMEVAIGYLTHHSEKIRKAILEAPSLEHCRDDVLQAGCEIFPSWANRAICLVPLAARQASEHLIAMDMQLQNLQPHHIFIRRRDIPNFHEAIFSSLPKRDRPKYRFEARSDMGECGLSARRVGDECFPSLPCEETSACHDLEQPDAQNDARAADVDASGDSVSGVANICILNTFILNTFIHVPISRSEASSIVQSAPCTNQDDRMRNPRRLKSVPSSYLNHD